MLDFLAKWSKLKHLELPFNQFWPNSKNFIHVLNLFPYNMKKVLFIDPLNSYRFAIIIWWEIQNLLLLITWPKIWYKLGSRVALLFRNLQPFHHTTCANFRMTIIFWINCTFADYTLKTNFCNLFIIYIF